MLKRALCPNCNKKLPLFIFRADRRIKRTPTMVLFRCPLCKSIIKAEVNETYKKNRILLLFVAFIMGPIGLICAGYTPKPFGLFVFFVVYIAGILIPITRGHHLMKFSKPNNEDLKI